MNETEMISYKIISNNSSGGQTTAHYNKFDAVEDPPESLLTKHKVVKATCIKDTAGQQRLRQKGNELEMVTEPSEAPAAGPTCRLSIWPRRGK